MQNKVISLLNFSIITFVVGLIFINSVHAQEKTQAELLAFEKGRKVLILHADDAGMCPEAHEAIEYYLVNKFIQSASVMMPCLSAKDYIEMAKTHPKKDVGIHLTFTSEWKTYRWGPVSDPASVPGLIDPKGKLWH